MTLGYKFSIRMYIKTKLIQLLGCTFLPLVFLLLSHHDVRFNLFKKNSKYFSAYTKFYEFYILKCVYHLICFFAIKYAAFDDFTWQISLKHNHDK